MTAMQHKIGLLSLAFGAIGFLIAVTSQDAPAGVFALCAGTLGYLAGKDRDDD
ncbi:hypothetical protein [Bifidobacterium samirii]|uniref:Uncharacterized protein n=1 Tax=Bifidobacterium samirii TaxID=2306974 RepID=A0A430FUB2_9BIFI|nr:hypothetical protein [Bifidobacterium samirii]RSX56760.1 hypothetical protein D2E24_1050 [Bifidobacterium samirii]